MAYAIAGLHVVSDIPLSGVASCPDDPRRPDTIRIRLRHVPASLDAPIVNDADLQWDGEQILLSVSGVARYLVLADRIDVQPLDGAPPGDVCAYLLGSILGALCHLRGIFPLRASTIRIGEQCVAFTGDSGAGKSTMAARLMAAGHRLISDDVTYFRPSATGRLQIWPGTNRLRLWESAMEGLGRDKRGIEREVRGLDKFLVPAESAAEPDRPLRLHAIYKLNAVTQGTSVAIERLRGSAAVDVLLQNTYRLSIAECVGRKHHVFAACTDVARQVPVFQLNRPMDFAMLDAVSNALEKHLVSDASVS